MRREMSEAMDPKQKRAAIVSALVLAAVAAGIYLTVIAKIVVYG